MAVMASTTAGPWAIGARVAHRDTGITGTVDHYAAPLTDGGLIVVVNADEVGPCRWSVNNVKRAPRRPTKETP